MIPVNVKWGRETFIIEVDTDDTGISFKEKLYKKTKIPICRQKIIGFKKGLLLNDTVLRDAGLKNNLRVMLVGTPEGCELETQKEPEVFEEDLSQSQRDFFLKTHQLDQPPKGLINCGTTCYFNSVIQFLRPVKELSEFISKLQTTSSCDIDVSFCAALRRFYQTKDKGDTTHNPMLVLHLLRSKFPQFGTMTAGNKEYLQQDAEECLSILLEYLNSVTPTKFIDSLFTFQIEKTILSEEDCNGSTLSQPKETLRILPCHLGSQLAAVDHLHEGLNRSLTETFTYTCPTTSQEIQAKKKSRLASLPRYLLIHFVRFEWKGRHELARTEAGRAKICRKVSFPKNLDMYDFLTEKLQSQLKNARDINQARRKNYLDDKKESNKTAKRTKCQQDTLNHDSTTPSPTPLQETLLLPTGEYELTSIITHQGRSADKGHYVAWTKHTEETWWKMDDETVTECEWKNIDLSGGRNDYHIAVVLLYKQKCVDYIPEEIPTKCVNCDDIKQND